jgi:hypothetical protein
MRCSDELGSWVDRDPDDDEQETENDQDACELAIDERRLGPLGVRLPGAKSLQRVPKCHPGADHRAEPADGVQADGRAAAGRATVCEAEERADGDRAETQREGEDGEASRCGGDHPRATVESDSRGRSAAESQPWSGL